MTRADVLNQFTVSHYGYITEVGKFEGEMLYAPYFYNAVMHGDGERIGDTDYFVITEEDRKEFPELTEYGVTLVETDNGFVYVRQHSKAAWNILREEDERMDAESIEE